MMKYISLCVLIVQNTALVLVMRYSRTVAGPKYMASTAVAMMEVVKLTTCSAVVYMECGGLIAFLRKLRIEIANKPKEMAKLSVPSLLYTVQNNLLYIALSNLEATTYQVAYQLKILTTAMFFVVLLRKHLSRRQWLSLCMLAAGVALAELPSASSPGGGSAAEEGVKGDQNHVLGLVCVLAASCTSGFAGVYFEMMLKGSKTTLWVRNIQMGIPSVLLALINVFGAHLGEVREFGFFYGYSGLVVCVITLQALGGLVVAVVVKYADNILKGFAAGASIITSCMMSIYLFDFQPSRYFLVGTLLVVLATYIYGTSPPPKPIRKRSFRKDELPSFHPQQKGNT